MFLPAKLASYLGPMQLVGYVACGISFSAFFAATQRRFLMIGATGALIWALHYHLLGDRVAAALSALSGGRNTIATHVHAMSRRLRLAVTLFVCAIVVTLALYSGSGPLAALPAFAACLTTTASFWLVGRAFRRAYLVSDSCWLVFAMIVGSIAGGVAATISLCLNVWTMRRMAKAAEAPPA